MFSGRGSNVNIGASADDFGILLCHFALLNFTGYTFIC